MLRIFTISKKLSINKQNFAAPAASGDPYDVNVLQTVELNTWAANFTFIIEYGIDFVCLLTFLEKYVIAHSWSS